jgi:hypothetical protein
MATASPGTAELHPAQSDNSHAESDEPTRLTIRHILATKDPAGAGLPRVGAPRFELGTSSPPDWRTPAR